MKPNNKKLFFVKEMPASEEQDVSTLKKVSKGEFDNQLKTQQKSNPKKKTKSSMQKFISYTQKIAASLPENFKFNRDEANER